MNFCILGAGAWGTAVAVHLDRCGHTVTLVPRRLEAALEMASSRENKAYLPGRRLAESLQIASEAGPALMEAEVVIFACPVAGLREACERFNASRGSSWRVRLALLLCKGLDLESGVRPTELASSLLENCPCGFLSGPSNAEEVADGRPTALSLAADADEAFIIETQEAMSSEHLRVYRSEDVVGVEMGAALKNVYAIGAGIVDGLGLGDNAKSALLTRSLSEMVTLGVACGGSRETFYGLSGFGDLIATCFGEWSRNRSFGEAVARGEEPESWIEKRQSVVEGYWSIRSFHELCVRKKIDVPILSEIHNVLFNKKPPAAAIIDLMQRPLKEEK